MEEEKEGRIGRKKYGRTEGRSEGRQEGRKDLCPPNCLAPFLILQGREKMKGEGRKEGNEEK